MPLTAPKLDSRTFKDLMDEARARIPRFTPEWTNFNDSDPGMTLVQLHAWMTETILYELNRVPDLNYVKFLDLIGVAPLAARPAHTQLAFTLDKLDAPNDALVVSVPLGTRVTVSDPDIKADIPFETDRTLQALNADFGMVLAPLAPDGQGAQTSLTRDLVSSWDAATQAVKWLHPFLPFGTQPQTGDCLYLGLVLRPRLSKPDLSLYVGDGLPPGPLDLYFDIATAGEEASQPGSTAAPIRHACEAAGLSPARLDWQIYTGPPEPDPGQPGPNGTPPAWRDDGQAGWASLAVTLDETRGLAQSGHLVLELPRATTAVDPRRLPLEFWDSFGALKPPVTTAELMEVLDRVADPSALSGLWPQMGITDAAALQDLGACNGTPAEIATILTRTGASPDPSRVPAAAWAALDPAFASASLPMAGDALRRLYWLRARFRAAPEAGAPAPAPIRQLRLNTVPATQGATRLEDRLGAATGRPGLTLRLPKAPVLIDPDTNAPVLDLSVGGETDWRRVPDFFGTGPDSAVYLLDPATGVLTFGDGLNGRIPVAGAQIVALRYRVGGGALGNVGPGAITKLRGAVSGVKSVTNPWPAANGSDAEPIEAVKLRAPHDLRHRDRAVSAQDFTDLALQTPGVALHSVTALPRTAVDATGDLVPRDGAVTLVLLPRRDEPRPQPSPQDLAAVCRWLEPRRLVTTELHLTAPRYVDVTQIAFTLKVDPAFDLGRVTQAVQDRILTFLNPIRGAADGQGWPFGQAILHADLYDLIMDVPGVRRAWGLQVQLDAPSDPAAPPDMAPIPTGTLPSLERAAIRPEVGYV